MRVFKLFSTYPKKPDPASPIIPIKKYTEIYKSEFMLFFEFITFSERPSYFMI